MKIIKMIATLAILTSANIVRGDDLLCVVTKKGGWVNPVPALFAVSKKGKLVPVKKVGKKGTSFADEHGNVYSENVGVIRFKQDGGFLTSCSISKAHSPIVAALASNKGLDAAREARMASELKNLTFLKVPKQEVITAEEVAADETEWDEYEEQQEEDAEESDYEGW